MEKVKQTKEYAIYKKRSERFAVKDANGKWINGDEKTKILLSEKLIKAPVPKPKEEAAPKADESASEETVAEEEPKTETTSEEDSKSEDAGSEEKESA